MLYVAGCHSPLMPSGQPGLFRQHCIGHRITGQHCISNSISDHHAKRETSAVSCCLVGMQKGDLCTWQSEAHLRHSGRSCPHNIESRIYSQRSHDSAGQCRRLRSLPCSTPLSRSLRTTLVGLVPTAHPPCHHKTLQYSVVHFAGAFKDFSRPPDASSDTLTPPCAHEEC